MTGVLAKRVAEAVVEGEREHKKRMVEQEDQAATSSQVISEFRICRAIIG